MKFGTQKDFSAAVTELKWLKSEGKLSDSSFVEIGRKYNFPEDFMKAGFEGLKYPDDYMLRKSKWFPILYSWAKDDAELEEVRQAAGFYGKSKYDLFAIFAIVTALMFFIALQILPFGNSGLFSEYPSTELPIVGLAISLSTGTILLFWRRVEERKERLRIARRKAEEKGFGESADRIIELARENPLFAYYSKDKEGVKINAFPIGVERKVPPILTRSQRLLSRVGRKPKEVVIPIFQVEVVDEEYLRRMQELNGEKEHI